MKKILSYILISLGLLFLAPATTYAATLNLSPASTSVGVGETKAVTVNLNAGSDSINAVAAIITYPSNLLDIAYVNYGGTFSIAAEGTHGGGAIRIVRGSITGATGNINVATIGFKGKSIGSAEVKFTGESAATRTSDSTSALTGNFGTTITVTQGTSSPTSSPKTTPTSQKPIISNVQVSDITANSATITWNTNIESSGYVDYGVSESELLLKSPSEEDFSTTHKAILDGDILKPGLKVFYIAKSRAGQGEEGVSELGSFQIKGYTVNLTIVDTEQNPLTNIPVTLNPGGIKLTTTDAGKVTFEDLTAGIYTLTAELGDKEQTQEFTVTEGKAEQTIVLTFNNLTPQFQGSTYYIPGAIVITLIIILLAAFLISKRLRRRNPPTPPMDSETSSLPSSRGWTATPDPTSSQVASTTPKPEDSSYLQNPTAPVTPQQ